LDDVRKTLLKDECDSDDDLHMGSNCRFSKYSEHNAMIKPSDEPKYSLLDIIEKKDDKHFLHIIQNAEFDLTQLRFEKGFKFNKDGSITIAPVQAFKINLDGIKKEDKFEPYEQVYDCKHKKTAECKRSLMFDLKLSAAYSELVSTSIGLSHENSDIMLKQDMTHTIHSYEGVKKGVLHIPDKNFILEKTFIEHVENVVNGKDTVHYKISKLCELSQKYGHFYARCLILGGTIIRNEEYTKNSVENSKDKITKAQGVVGIASNILKFGVNAVNANKDTSNNYTSKTSISETIIGGDYSQNDKNLWRQSLNADATKWKIIGYEGIYSLFDLLDEELKKKVLSVMGHQILEANVKEIDFSMKEYKKTKMPYIHKVQITNETINISECNILASIVSQKENIFSLYVDYMDGNKNRPVIVIHHIKGERAIPMFSNKTKIKIGWIIFGPPTDFNFSIQHPLVFKSGKYSALREKDYHIINNHGMFGTFGTCVLDAVNISPQIESSSDTETVTQIVHNPRESPFVIGNYLTRRQDSVCQESSLLFVYDIKAEKKVTDEKVLKRLALYSCNIDKTNSRQVNDFFGEMKFDWIKRENKEILQSSKKINISNDNHLILVNRIFDHDDCRDCQPLGFVNVISDKICYGSLNSKHLSIDKSDGSIVYLSIPLKKG
ncbi:2458_t:CDS:2, partial [Cetraspora pellucida]